MPYKKPTIKFIGIRELCLGKGIRSPQLAKILDCSENTALKKLKDPRLFTLDDLDNLSRKGHIKWEEIQGGMK